MQTYAMKAGLLPEKRKFHNLKHSIATHLLDAHGELKFVQDWVGHKNIQNTTKYAQLTNPGVMRRPGSSLRITEWCETILQAGMWRGIAISPLTQPPTGG
jgi:integrase